MTSLTDQLAALPTLEEADAAQQALTDRRKTLLAERIERLKAGDTITFNDRISTRYLIGLEAKVSKVNPKSVVVDCPDEPAYGRTAGRSTRLPKTLIGGVRS